MDFFKQVKEKITANVNAAIEKAQSDGALPQAEKYEFTVEIPKDASFGDFATNAAMLGARVFRKAPQLIAKEIVDRLPTDSWFSEVSVAGAFINFKLSPEFSKSVVDGILSEGENYGKSDFGEGKRVLVEFVSANPTGPMHIGNARGGANGDCLASILNFAGYKADREFYVNDAGNQIEKFGLSLSLRYLQLYKEGIEMPEDSYHGEDIVDHAKAFAEIYGDKYVEADDAERKKALVDFALPKNVEALERDLKKYRIVYDRWFRESELYKNGQAQKVVAMLTESGYTYEQEGAVWFKATEFGCEKDFVLVRSNGLYTYVVPDIAYHYNKLVTRGYDKAIDVLGADHHGYVPRLKGALTALGVDASKLDAVIIQMVRLIKDGEVTKQSKRSGKAITLVTLLEEVPIDAARFFFNMREPNSHFDFDLDLAVSQTNQNPVYYVQYAHARICSILAGLNEEKVPCDRECTSALGEPQEKALVKQLALFTGEVVRAAQSYDISLMTKYAVDLSSSFHSFYNGCRVKCEESDKMYARIALIKAVKQTLENVLGIIKVTAPEHM